MPRIVTIENYLKWYKLYRVDANATVHEIENDGTIRWADHIPCPADIVAYAERHGYNVDSQAIEMIVGRWVIEVENREPDFIGFPTPA